MILNGRRDDMNEIERQRSEQNSAFPKSCGHSIARSLNILADTLAARGDAGEINKIVRLWRIAGLLYLVRLVVILTVCIAECRALVDDLVVMVEGEGQIERKGKK